MYTYVISEANDLYHTLQHLSNVFSLLASLQICRKPIFKKQTFYK